MSRLFAATLLGMAALAVASVAEAGFITYNFDGPVVGTGGTEPRELPFELVDKQTLLQQRISGSITISDAAIDTNPDPEIGQYQGPEAITQFSVTFAGRTFVLDFSRPDADALIFVLAKDTPPFPEFPDDPPSNSVQFGVNLGRGILPEAPDFTAFATLIFFPPDLQTLVADQIPPDLTRLNGAFQSSLFFFRNEPFASSGGISEANVTLVAPNAVPEPSTIAMFAMGLLALIFLSRGRRWTLQLPAARAAVTQ